jgi:hypothetical protein
MTHCKPKQHTAAYTAFACGDPQTTVKRQGRRDSGTVKGARACDGIWVRVTYPGPCRMQRCIGIGRRAGVYSTLPRFWQIKGGKHLPWGKTTTTGEPVGKTCDSASVRVRKAAFARLTGSGAEGFQRIRRRDICCDYKPADQLVFRLSPAEHTNTGHPLVVWTRFKTEGRYCVQSAVCRTQN